MLIVLSGVKTRVEQRSSIPSCRLELPVDQLSYGSLIGMCLEHTESRN